MTRWPLCLCLFLLAACAPRKLAVDPRDLMTPREVYLTIAMAYGDEDLTRWRDFQLEISKLESEGLIDRFTVKEQATGPRTPHTSITAMGERVAEALGWVSDFHEHPNLRSGSLNPQPLVIPLTEDLPVLPGTQDFYRLTTQAAIEKGRDLAQQDYTRGVYRMLVYGLPDSSTSGAAEWFLHKHSVFIYPIPGLMVTDGIKGVVEGYNSVMSGLLKTKFQADLFEQAKQMKPSVARAYDPLTPREIFLILDMAYGTWGSLQWYEFVPELSILETSGFIQRHYDEEQAHQYRFPCASLTLRGEHLAIMLGWNRNCLP